jgi:hypothetical protein
MPNAAVTAFLTRIEDDENLRQALVRFAARHGFQFTLRDLAGVDFRSLVAAAPPDQPDDRDGEVDPGFGIGEFPA